MANSAYWHGHVLRREDDHVLGMALEFKFEGQRKKGRLKKRWKLKIVEECVKVGLRQVGCTLLINVGC